MKKLFLWFLLPLLAFAEVRTLTLREAAVIAIRQNPDLVIARLDHRRAQLAIDIQRDPYSLKMYAGSGAVYTSGYPQSIDGRPPSIVEARAVMAIYNRPQNFLIAQAKENARGSDFAVSRQQDDVLFRVASLFLEAQQAGRVAQAASRQADSLQKVLENVRQRVEEGRELSIQAKRAELDSARARQRAEAAGLDQESAESTLALVLGFGAEDRIRPADDDFLTDPPESEDRAVQDALANNNQIKLLESQMQAKGLEIKSYEAQRWPSVDLVAQYAMLAEYNLKYYYPDTRFQRNNGQLGASFTVPVFAGRAPKAYAAQGEADLAKLKVQYNATRNQIVADSRKAYQEVHRVETARDVAKLDLDVAREQLRILEAQYDEGRISVRDLETGRVQESEKSLAYYQAQNEVEKVRLNLLRQMGTLTAALK